jgi:hypothetical protein
MNQQFNSTSTGLPIHPVLESGYIIFAHTHYGDVRTVTFENPEAGESPEGGNVKAHFGSGQSIDEALKQALQSYHRNSANYRGLYSKNERTYRKRTVTAKLDKWLAAHKGTLRAVSDFDGTVLVTLRGLAKPFDKQLPSLVMHGCGMTFYEALESAFSGSFDYQAYTAPAKQIDIQTEVAAELAEQLITAADSKQTSKTPNLQIKKRAHLSFNS